MSQINSSTFDGMRWSFRSGLVNLLRGKGRYHAAAIVCTLGMAIGATLAITSVVACARLKPLPYARPSELRMVWHAYPGLAAPKSAISVPSYELYRSLCSSVFRDIAVFASARDGNLLLSDDSDPISTRTLSVTPNIFSVLGVRPLQGRLLVDEDAQISGVLPVVASYAFWREHFGTEAAIGKRVTINGRPAQIVGVMPERFQIVEASDLWVPLFFSSRDLAPTEHGNEYLTAVARLQPGTSDAKLRTALEQVSSIIRSQYPQYYPARFGWYVYTSTLVDEMTGHYRSEFVLLTAAAIILNIIALVNVSALLLSRSALKAQYYAVKLALGSSMTRIFTEVIGEMLAIAALANGIGILVAQLCLQSFRVHVLPHIGQNVPPWNTVGIDPSTTWLVILVDTSILVAFGLLPLQILSQNNLGHFVQSPSRATMGRKYRLVLNSLVATDIAIALILSVLSIQLLTTIRHLNAVDPGFVSRGIETFKVVLPRNTYSTRAAFDRFQEDLVSALRNQHNVQAAGLTSSLPFLNSEANALLLVEGQDTNAPASVNYITCSANYFSALGIPLRAGRAFNNSDTAGSVPVVIVDQSATRRFFRDSDPTGKRVAFTFEKESDGTPHWREVVGVVGHIRDQTLRDDTDSQFYVPYAQATPKSYTYVVRGASSDVSSISSDVRSAIKRIDPRLPLHHVRALQEIVADSFAITAISAVLVGFFASAATILTVIGIYGTVSYSVLLRRREMGIRIAFGASRSRILIHVLSRYLIVAGAAIVMALPLSIALGFWIRTALYNVTPYEWFILLSASLLVAVLTLISSYVPALSASKSDPARVLRVE